MQKQNIMIAKFIIPHKKKFFSFLEKITQSSQN